LSALPVEQFTTLRADWNRVLLLLARAICESFVLRKLKVDESRANDQHPKANKSRDKKRAA
jgi:hypothetical protein